MKKKVQEKFTRLFKYRLNKTAAARSIRRLQKKPVIHVFGDSHTDMFQDVYYLVHYVGPATAYKLPYSESTVKAGNLILRQLKAIYKRPHERLFLFVFGEIDCRLHVYNQHKKKHINIDLLIDNTVKAYGKFLKEVKRRFPLAKILVFNVVPPGEQGNYYNYPFYAERSVQVEITKTMNKKLASMCKSNNFFFVNIYDSLVDAKGNRLNEYAADEVHIHKKAVRFVNEALKRMSVI